MSLAVKVGELLIGAAKVLAHDVKPKSTAVVLAATRSDKAKFVAPTSSVDPNAKLDTNASVWFNARVGAGTKVGKGACILDGAMVEENCTLGDMCVVKPGAVVKRGSTIGSRVVIGVGAVVPERSNVKDSTILSDGWNGSTVTESSINPTFAEEEALHVYQLATEQQTTWSRSLEQRTEALEAILSERRNPQPSEKWENFVSVHPNPSRNPERRGLIFDK
jgi:carbonic anhydrase/acetyltransferase-like protein (isoleucine patch superfamily)